MAQYFNIRERARKRLKKLWKSIEAGMDSTVASERIACRQLAKELADVEHMEQPAEEPIQVVRAKPSNVVALNEAV
jgi:hypothetical protein